MAFPYVLDVFRQEETLRPVVFLARRTIYLDTSHRVFNRMGVQSIRVAAIAIEVRPQRINLTHAAS